jgi:Rieske Fe-S protein
MSSTRRSFLLWLGRGTAAGVALLGGAFGLGFFAHGHGRGTRTRRYLGRRAEVLARLEARREGYWIDEENGVLLLRDDEQPAGLRAISLACTHLGCTLRPAAGHRTLECPCHGSAFALMGDDGRGAELGRVLVGPATRDLERFDVVRVGDHLFLEA